MKKFLVAILITVLGIMSYANADKVYACELQSEQSLVDLKNWKETLNFDGNPLSDDRNYKDIMDTVANAKIVSDRQYKKLYAQKCDAYSRLSNQENIENLENEIKCSSIISQGNGITIRMLDQDEVSPTGFYLAIDSIKGIVKYLEMEELIVNKGINLNKINSTIAITNKSSTDTKDTCLTKLISPVVTANLYGTVKYNKNNKEISSVTNRKLTLSGVTAFQAAENVSTHYYLSPKAKAVKITGQYDDVNYILCPWGRIEVTRNNAYLQYKWSVEKGMYSEEGGFGKPDTTF